MTAYLGSLGSLVRVECPADQSKDTERPTRYVSTLGGSMFAQVGPRTKRSWDVRLPRISTPAEVATWQAFVEGEYGDGPWWFVPEMAATTNLVSPRGSVLDHGGSVHGGTSPNGGPMVLPDGSRAGRSWLVEPDVTLILPWVGGSERVPVLPGVPVTASLWVAGSTTPQMRVAVYDGNGSFTRYVYGTTSTGAVAERFSVTFTPNAGESSCVIFLAGASSAYRVARPAVTWTDSVRPWAVGAGAPAVHVAGFSEDVTLAVDGREMVSASLKVQEVG